MEDTLLIMELRMSMLPHGILLPSSLTKGTLIINGIGPSFSPEIFPFSLQLQERESKQVSLNSLRFQLVAKEEVHT
jgi:hypothetical protein